MADELALPVAKGIQSIENGYRILQALEQAPGPLPLKHLAAQAGMPASKTRFYLNSLMRCGLVVQAAAGGVYDLGPAALRLGVAALSHLDVIRIARDAVWVLVDETGASAFLSVWGSRGATVIHRVDGRHGSPLEVRLGTILPPLSATGRALLASQPPETARKLLVTEVENAQPHDVLNGLSIADALAAVDEVRSTGLAFGSGASAPGTGFRAVAAAVVDHTGEGRTALTLLSASPNKAQSERLGKAVLQAVQRISQDAGAPQRAIG
jgi:DNA-binding IclR family transcriptional regulator